jgi:2-polyprenyl-6-methoxyphenol hydroxylase-like FAD-dependent oxidoreductase
MCVAVHRADLQNTLLAQLPSECVRNGKKCVHVSQSDSAVALSFDDGSSAEGDYLIAADGINSLVRRSLIPGSEPRFAGYTCWRAITHAPDLVRGATEYWGVGRRIGLIQLKRGQLYYFACTRAREGNGRARLASPEDLAMLFTDFGKTIPDLIRDTPANALIWNDVFDIAPIPRFAFGRILLVGDAAHASTPDMGQGACQAVEDATVLASCLATESADSAFAAFERQRIGRAHRIQRMSRWMGRMAQLGSPTLARLRNTILRLIPAKIVQRSLRWVFDVNL